MTDPFEGERAFQTGQARDPKVRMHLDSATRDFEVWSAPPNPSGQPRSRQGDRGFRQPWEAKRTRCTLRPNPRAQCCV